MSGDREVLLLGDAEVAAALEPAALIDALAAGFRALARDEVAAPARSAVRGEGEGSLLTMPGHRAGGALAVKHVGLYPGNPRRGLPAHPAVICVFAADTGTLEAILAATALTALRTAGAAALAVRLAARPDARVAAVVGTGPVARAHLDLLAAARPFTEIRVAARTPAAARAVVEARLRSEDDATWASHEVPRVTSDKAAPVASDEPARAASDKTARVASDRAAHEGPRLVAAPSLEAAVRGADVVCLCTSAAEPVIDPAWLAPGAHVSSVGFAPPGGELDPALARDGRLLVESRDAFAPPPAGCAELAGIDPAEAAELGEVLLGRRSARANDGELTVYKSMGHIVEDLAAAELAVAVARPTGRRVAL